MQLISLLAFTVVAGSNTSCTWLKDAIQEPVVGLDIGLTYGFVFWKL